MHFLEKLLRRHWRNLCLHQVSEPLLLYFISIIIAVTVSLGIPYAISTYSLFSLCMESNGFEKSTNDSVASRFFARTPSTSYPESVKLLIDFPENISEKNFFDFSLDSMKKQSIINFSSYNINSYFSVLRNFEVTFLGEAEGAAFCSFLYCILLIDSFAKFHQISLCSIQFRGVSSRLTAFQLLSFVCTTSSSSSVNWLSLMFSWL